jgi:hypothetical protein
VGPHPLRAPQRRPVRADQLTTALGPSIGAGLASLLDGYDAIFLLLGVIAAAAAGVAAAASVPASADALVQEQSHR